MDAVIAEAVTNLQLLIEESGAKVDHTPLPTLNGDKVLLVQLIQNLVANGIKYRRPDVTPHLHISAQRMDESWTFAVEDNGQGIDPRYRTQIFELLKRLHGDDVPGTGMGLALCKKVVERHGGRIWVDSTPGKGSTFYFTLRA
jgi:light-regulated signal transduction histidine kinase (bacteriophytochrome)